MASPWSLVKITIVLAAWPVASSAARIRLNCSSMWEITA